MKPKAVPAGQTLVLGGSVSSLEPSSDKWVLIETPSEFSLPGGLLCHCRITFNAECDY